MSDERTGNDINKGFWAFVTEHRFFAYLIPIILLVLLLVMLLRFNFGNLVVNIVGLWSIFFLSIYILKLIQYAVRLRVREKVLIANEKEYKALADKSPDLIMRYDKDFRHIYINPIYSRYTGIEPSQLIGKTIEDTVALFPGLKSEIVKWEKMIEEVKNTGVSKNFTYLFDGKNKKYYFQTYLAREFDLENRNYSVIATMRDITKEKDNESQVVENELRFRTITEKLPFIPVIGLDKDRKIIFWNDASVKSYGLKKEQAIGSLVEDIIIIPEDKKSFIKSFDKWINSNEQIQSEETVRKGIKNSKIRVFAQYLKVLNINEEPELYILDLDLSRFDKSSDQTGIDRETLISLFNNIDEIVYIADPETNEILFINKFGSDHMADESVNNKCYQALRMNTDPCAFHGKKKKNPPLGKTERWEHFDPETNCYYLITDKIIPWKDNKKVKFTIIMDITPYKNLEMSLITEKNKLYSALESFGEGIITTDQVGKITLLNKAAEEITGWEANKVEGKKLEEILVVIDEKTGAPSDKSVQELIETNTMLVGEENLLIVSKDGAKKVISINGAPINNEEGSIIGDIIVFRDVTTRKRKEDELIKSQKLESLGTLAAGIAYDFNNLLSTLFGYIEMAMVFHNSKEKVSQYLSRALGIYDRATNLTDKLITFSRRGIPDKKSVDIFELLEDTAQFSLGGSKVRYSLELPEDIWLCDIDRTQIQQVFSNILLNSLQAMPDGGLITIKGENVPVSDAPEWSGKASNYVKITVIDEGTGIPESYLERIFDPFFTTKQQGSGLGLATAYSIINKHQGSIDVSSVPGQGTTVEVLLPASQSAIHDLDSEEEIIEKYESKILIMDDDPIISDTIKEALLDLGYTVMNCSNGSKALLIYEEEYLKGEPFDLVIFDLTVPGELGGLETLQILREKYPNIIALASSGYLDNPVMTDPQKFGFCDKIEKPYNIDDFIIMVHKALGDLKE